MNRAKHERVELSIIIAAWNNASLLRQCLASLEKQTDKAAIETIVVSNFATDSLENEFSAAARFFRLPETAIVPQLRSQGVKLARGEIIALLEDHCFFDERWSEEIKKAHAETSRAAVGGSVENASLENALDWAVYFYDYGKYMLPNRAGASASLSGINVSYKRALLAEIAEIYRDGFYETFVNEELKKRNHQLIMQPAAIVYHNKNYETSEAARHCYHLARSFAAQRVADVSFLKRAVYAMVSLILPILLPARIVSNVVNKGRNIGQLMRALPILFALMLIWSYGELCGYLLGEGKSSAQWR
jgi:glycosyltransferase involved in cell wall biosynthesis